MNNSRSQSLPTPAQTQKRQLNSNPKKSKLNQALLATLHIMHNGSHSKEKNIDYDFSSVSLG